MKHDLAIEKLENNIEKAYLNEKKRNINLESYLYYHKMSPETEN